METSSPIAAAAAAAAAATKRHNYNDAERSRDRPLPSRVAIAPPKLQGTGSSKIGKSGPNVGI